MHPVVSFASSQVLPAPVGSDVLPGAKVPVSNASWGSAPIALTRDGQLNRNASWVGSRCWAKAKTMALFVAAALVLAGS